MLEVNERLMMRVEGGADRPTLVYLPGLHGDWTLVGGFRRAVVGRLRFVEFCYPRTVEWTLADYAQAVEGALSEAGVAEGWLLAESFGSQVGWALMNRGAGFKARGLVLAGGFGGHPWPGMVRLGEKVLKRVSAKRLRLGLQLYGAYARVRHGWRDPAALPEIAEFIARRTEPDGLAAAHRLRLIAGADWRATAGAVRCPVYYLTGFWDPIVPWPWVRGWLRRYCPACCDWRLVGLSDHNVLGAAARVSARQVLTWMGVESDGRSPRG